jgi:GntR family transcriptional regulator
LASQGRLRRDLIAWLRRARAAGLEQEDVVALVETTMRTTFQEGGFQEGAG